MRAMTTQFSSWFGAALVSPPVRSEIENCDILIVKIVRATDNLHVDVAGALTVQAHTAAAEHYGDKAYALVTMHEGVKGPRWALVAHDARHNPVWFYTDLPGIASSLGIPEEVFLAAKVPVYDQAGRDAAWPH